MKESDPLYIKLSHYFEMGKFNTITSHKEKEHVLENLRVGIFELLDRNLQTFNEDIFDFVFEGLSKLGLEFDDLLPNPHSINKKILDILFSLTLKDIYCETRYYLIDTIKKICRMLNDFKSDEINTSNYLKNKIAYFLINYDFNTIQDLWDEGIFNFIEEEELIRIYENPKANLEKKLNIAFYEIETSYYSSTEDAAVNIYVKLREYGINPLLNWISQPYVDGIGSAICSFFKKMETKIVKPFKICISKAFLNNDFFTIDKLMTNELIKLLDKKTIIDIFWDDKTLESFIDICLEMKTDILGDRVIIIIRKIGGDAFKLLHKAFKLPFFPELLLDVINEFDKTQSEEITNLLEGILYADKINDMVYPLIIILCNFLIKRISKEDIRTIILDTNILGSIFEISIPDYFNVNPPKQFIEEIFKKDPDLYREILYGILKNNSKYSEKISKYALDKYFL